MMQVERTARMPNRWAVRCSAKDDEHTALVFECPRREGHYLYCFMCRDRACPHIDAVLAETGTKET